LDESAFEEIVSVVQEDDDAEATVVVDVFVDELDSHFEDEFADYLPNNCCCRKKMRHQRKYSVEK
jgi:hypothetical protein